MFDNSFYGTSTIGEKGQVVIPAKARDKLAIKAGDEFIFFGHGKMIHIVKASEINEILDKMTQKFSRKISEIKDKVNQSKGGK